MNLTKAVKEKYKKPLTSCTNKEIYICLLEQLGYDGSQLYNAGTFSNGMGNIIAYKDYPDAKYHVPGTNVYTVASQFVWNESLTPILDE